LLSEALADGVELNGPEALAERDADRVPLAVALSEGMLEKVKFSGLAVSLLLRETDGEPEEELEFHALRERAAVDEALADIEELTVADAVALKDTVALPLLLAVPLALAQLEAEDEALGSDDSDGVAEVELVELKEMVARPLLLAVLLALAQFVVVALAEVVPEPRLDTVGVAVVLGEEDPVTVEDTVGRNTVTEGEPLVVTEVVATADRLGVGVIEPEDEVVLPADKEPLALAVKQLDGVALSENEFDGVLLACMVGDGTAEPEGGAHREGVGELVGDAVSQLENEAAVLREGCPDTLPVIEMEATLVPEELNDGEGVLEELRHALAVKEEEPLADTETVMTTDLEEITVVDALRVPDEDDEMLLDGDPEAQGVAMAEDDALAEGVESKLRDPANDGVGLSVGDALLLTQLVYDADPQAVALIGGVADKRTEAVGLLEKDDEGVAQALGDSARDGDGSAVRELKLLTLAEYVAELLREGVSVGVGDPTTEALAPGDKDGA